MKIGRKLMRKTASVATKFLFITVFTKAIKHGIIKGAKKMSSVFGGMKKKV